MLRKHMLDLIKLSDLNFETLTSGVSKVNVF